MDINNAKQQVITAGKRLVENGLIARTWGNVSCRVDEENFVITPSGKAYDSLVPDDIVQVRTADLSYEGETKPSSEKGVHAEVYKARPEVNFVIHTHQNKASVISALDRGIRDLIGDAAVYIGGDIPLAEYGLPGTGKLKKGVAVALTQTKGNAILMAHHGALCYAVDSEAAFQVASLLEIVCGDTIYSQFRKVFGENPKNENNYVEFVLKKLTKCESTIDFSTKSCYNSKRSGENSFLLWETDGREQQYPLQGETARESDGSEPPEATLHRRIYQAREDISVILQNKTAAVAGLSCLAQPLLPQLDDFAQLIGISVRTAAPDDASACVQALKGRHAVFLEGQGALCCGKNESDARAVELVLEKGCITKLGSMLFGCDRVISSLESRLMRYIYLKKYSKKE